MDSNTYAALTDKILRLKDDIALDVGAVVEIKSGDWSNSDDVRSVIKQYYNQGNLIGTILIGNIAPSCVGYDMGISGNTMTSDFMYADLDGADPRDNSYSGFHPENLPEVWIGRITPPTSFGQEKSIQAIASYLDRNHSFRRKELSFPERGLFIDSILPEDWFYQEVNPQQIYTDNNAIVLLGESATKANTLSEIQRGWEFISIRTHGTAAWQVFPNQDGILVSPSGQLFGTDLESSPPNAIYVDLTSCGAGQFSNPDYIAGYYLFSGSVLAVGAPASDVVASGAGLKLSTVQWGLILGEELKYYILPAFNFFGDPTLRLREAPGPVARVSHSRIEIDFGSKPATRDLQQWLENHRMTECEITIYNQGEGMLKIAPVSYRLNDTALGGVEGHAMNAFGVSEAEEASVSPGRSTLLKISFGPSLIGVAQCAAVYPTNDPENPYIIIHLIGCGT